MTRVLLLPFITTVWTPVVLAIINVIQAALEKLMMPTVMTMRGDVCGAGAGAAAERRDVLALQVDHRLLHTTRPDDACGHADSHADERVLRR